MHGHDLTVVKLHLYEGDRFLVSINYLMLLETKNKFGFEDEYTEESEDVLNAINPLMGGVCGKCLNGYQYLENIRNVLANYRY